jgi:hypothetical protein
MCSEISKSYEFSPGSFREYSWQARKYGEASPQNNNFTGNLTGLNFLLADE